MDTNPRKNERRGRRLLNLLMTDGAWEVCLILVATPVLVSKFLSIGTGFVS